MIQCFIDLDGVMVDLHKGLKEKLNFEFPIDRDKDIIHSMWYNIANNHPTFWMDLEPTPYYKELYKAIIDVCKNPLILSATPEPYVNKDNDNCKSQKISWVYKHLGAQQALNTIITKSKLKQNFINPEYGINVLIDDHPLNIKRWQNAGGIGIHHVNVEDTIKQLKELK